MSCPNCEYCEEEEQINCDCSNRVMVYSYLKSRKVVRYPREHHANCPWPSENCTCYDKQTIVEGEEE